MNLAMQSITWCYFRTSLALLKIFVCQAAVASTRAVRKINDFRSLRQQLHGARGCVAELIFNSVVVSWTLDTDRETAALRYSAQQGKVCFRCHWQTEHVVLTQAFSAYSSRFHSALLIGK